MGDRFQVVSNRAFDACFDSSGISRSALSSGAVVAFREHLGWAFAAVFTSIDSIFRFMENIVARSAGNISRHMASVGNYLEFCRQNGFAADDGQVRGASDGCCIAEESESGRESCAVIVEDVSFAYPNATDRLSIEYRFGFGRGRRLRSLVKTELEKLPS